METCKLENDIDVFCVKAKSFPAGIGEAHQTLHTLVPEGKGRRYFGISRPENGQGIVYRAGAEELKPGELAKLNLEKFVIKKGNYIYVDVIDFRNNHDAIGQAFNQMLNDPRIDPQGACIEWYTNEKDSRCMVRLK